MYRSLRRGHASVYLQHQITGHNVGADLFESEVAGGIATLRLRLRPADGNQRDDVLYLGTDPLISATLVDSQVVSGFIKHANARVNEIHSWRLIIIFGHQIFSFSVQPSTEVHGLLQMLAFQVVTKLDH